MSESHTVRLDLPASIEYLGLPGACILEMFAQIAVPDRDRVAYEVRLAASELLTNIVQHGYAGQEGRVLVALVHDREGGQFIIETRDQTSCAFDPACVPEPDVESLDGRGLYLLRQLVDHLSYCDGSGQAWESSAAGPFVPVAPASDARAPDRCWRLVKRL